MSFLPGMSPGFIAGGKLTTLTMVGSNVSELPEITTNTTVLFGDLIVHLDYSGSAGSGAEPSGFTIITDQDADITGRCILSYKIAAGGESSLTGITGNTFDQKCLYVFRGNVPIKSVTVGSAQVQGTSGNPSAQVLTASSGTPPLIVIGGFGSVVEVNPRSFTPAKDGEINTPDFSSLWLAYKIYNLAPQDTTIDMDDESTSNVLTGCYIACEG